MVNITGRQGKKPEAAINVFIGILKKKFKKNLSNCTQDIISKQLNMKNKTSQCL